MTLPPVVDPTLWEELHDSIIAPLMDQIAAVCQQNGIPCSCIFQVTDGEDPVYCTTQIPTHASLKLRRLIVAWQQDIVEERPETEWRVPSKGDAPDG